MRLQQIAVRLWRVAVWCLVLIVSPIATAQDARQPENWKWNIPDGPRIPGVRHGEIDSPSMKRVVGYNILLPTNYDRDSTQRYSVVYYLHGASGTEATAGDLAWLVKEELAAGRIGDVIYVFPNGGSYSRYRDWPAANVKAETLLMRELIPHVDATYRTLARREGRAACGFSMGGDGALRLAMKHPETFCAVGTLAAALDWEVAKDETDSVYHWSRKHADKLADRLPLLLIVGKNDGLHRSHIPFIEHLRELKFQPEFVVHDDIGHNLGELKRLSGSAMIQMLAKHYAPATRP